MQHKECISFSMLNRILYKFCILWSYWQVAKYVISVLTLACFLHLIFFYIKTIFYVALLGIFSISIFQLLTNAHISSIQLVFLVILKKNSVLPIKDTNFQMISVFGENLGNINGIYETYHLGPKKYVR